jgi:hypothetical protein
MQIDRLGNKHFVLVRDKFLERSEQLKEAARKFIHADIDPMIALRNVYEADNAYIVDGYLVVYDISTMWWSDTPILAEQLIFALNSDGRFSSVIEFLEAKAREAGAKYLCVGTALAKSDAALASVYERNGFSRMAINLCKEI